MAGLREVAIGLRFPEGPVAMPDGSVLVVEIAAGCLTRVAQDGTKNLVAETGGGPNGAAIMAACRSSRKTACTIQAYQRRT
jgi:gluconolactonase